MLLSRGSGVPPQGVYLAVRDFVWEGQESLNEKKRKEGSRNLPLGGCNRAKVEKGGGYRKKV